MFELRQSADLSGWNHDATDARWRSFVEGLQRFTDKPVPASEFRYRKEYRVPRWENLNQAHTDPTLLRRAHRRGHSIRRGLRSLKRYAR
jgi:hypothetical protein